MVKELYLEHVRIGSDVGRPGASLVSESWGSALSAQLCQILSSLNVER